MTRGSSLAAAVAALTALASAPAAAETAARRDPATQPGAADRTLNGHVFTPGLLIRSPFATTSFVADLQYGAGEATGTKYIGNQPLETQTFTFAAEAQNFGYEKKLFQGVSIGAGVVSQLYSGVDGPSVVVLGTQIGAGAFGRVTAGRRLGPVHAALYFDATYGPRFGILVLDAIEQALGGNADTASAFAQSNTWTLQPGVAAAWAPHPAIGITGSVDYQWLSLDTTSTRRQNESGVDAAIATDLNLGHWTRVAMTIVGAYRLTAPLGSDGVSRVVDWSAGAYYTGRPALALGLEVGFRSFTYRALDANATVAQIRMQYFW